MESKGPSQTDVCFCAKILTEDIYSQNRSVFGYAHDFVGQEKCAKMFQML